MKIHTHRFSQGFTLIELLVTMLIIATLGAISSVVLFKQFSKAGDDATRIRINLISETLSSHVQEFSDEPIPDGDGSSTSSIQLYSYLSGDGYAPSTGTYTTPDGLINGSEVDGPLTDLLPPQNNDGSLNFTSRKCMVNEDFAIRDQNFEPIRYLHTSSTNTATKNNFTGGFDIWAAGEDKQTDDNPAATADSLKDDITNW